MPERPRKGTAPRSAARPVGGGNGNRIGTWLALAVLVLVLDQLTKYLANGTLDYGQRVPVLRGFFDFTLAYNKGAAFSFLAGAGGWQRWFFTGLGIAAALFIIWLLFRHGSQKLFALALALILGGAVGNVIDRIIYGHVIDFILLYWRTWFWPAFNIADSAIVGGASLLILDELLRVRRSRG